jgi:hypothetical protein
VRALNEMVRQVKVRISNRCPTSHKLNCIKKAISWHYRLLITNL